MRNKSIPLRKARWAARDCHQCVSTALAGWVPRKEIVPTQPAMCSSHGAVH